MAGHASGLVRTLVCLLEVAQLRVVLADDQTLDIMDTLDSCCAEVPQ